MLYKLASSPSVYLVSQLVSYCVEQMSGPTASVPQDLSMGVLQMLTVSLKG
jgi:hypothetical protein